MIELAAGPHTARVDDECGGRLASLRFDGREVLVTHDVETTTSPLGWGSYPMVPFAGRIRHGRFTFDGRVHSLPLNMPPHAIHGTVFESRWDVVDTDDLTCRLRCDLGEQWPFRGRVEHVIALRHDSTGRGGVDHRLTVFAEEPMPAQVGWHPWFVRPVSSRLRFRAMHRRDAEGIARPVESPIPDLVPGAIDDSFVDPQEILTLHYDTFDLELTSTCRDWVVYDEPTHATCVEPQSGPPDALNHAPSVVTPSQPMTHRFAIEWVARAARA
ncbi:MAG: aldose epimerase [Acidimicrobiales bacterium mtb01]|nr:aldose epimerase [Actinomycetota bacterium]TEX45857.1 MAG: aldose epimerase [Acidimicrobiales bacterium mtb01]